nr:uroporphyrinogen-III synthase [Acidipropionibacterium acidipropionici]
MSSAVTAGPSGIIRPPVLVPRQGAHDRIGAALKHAGFGVIHQPVTRTVEIDGGLGTVGSHPSTVGALGTVGFRSSTAQPDWLVVTSHTAVRILQEAGLLDGLALKVAAVGRATARALKDAGVDVDLVPQQQSGAGLVDAWADPGARVLLPVSALAAPTVGDGLREQGCDVTRVDLYTTEPLDELPEVIAQAWPAFGAVVVTSSSVARALDSLVSAAGLSWTARQHPVAMGRPTADTLSELGHPAAAVAAAPTPEAILTAVESVIS